MVADDMIRHVLYFQINVAAPVDLLQGLQGDACAPHSQLDHVDDKRNSSAHLDDWPDSTSQISCSLTAAAGLRSRGSVSLKLPRARACFLKNQ